MLAGRRHKNHDRKIKKRRKNSANSHTCPQIKCFLVFVSSYCSPKRHAEYLKRILFCRMNTHDYMQIHQPPNISVSSSIWVDQIAPIPRTRAAFSEVPSSEPRDCPMTGLSGRCGSPSAYSAGCACSPMLRDRRFFLMFPWDGDLAAAVSGRSGGGLSGRLFARPDVGCTMESCVVAARLRRGPGSGVRLRPALVGINDVGKRRWFSKSPAGVATGLAARAAAFSLVVRPFVWANADDRLW